MKLRKRAPARVINEENEEDVDDPADDSDCDPEWEEPEVNSDIPFGSGRKRKSFIPLQMQNDGSKAKIVDQADKPSFIPLQMQNDGSKAKIVDQADKPSSSGAGVSSEKIAQTSSKPTKDKKRITAMYRDKSLDKKKNTPLFRCQSHAKNKITPMYKVPLDKIRIPPLYRDRTLEKKVDIAEDEEIGGEEIERADMYSELELIHELGLKMSDCNLLKNSLHLNAKSNLENCKFKK